MNYEKIYNSLVEKAKPRGLDKSQHEGYFEIHHIVPRSLGGTNADDNLVMFTAREHFIAHMLLWKAYPQENSLFYAAMMMSNRFTDRKSRLYESMKQILAAKMSERRKGKYKDLTGQKFGKLRVIELARLQPISEDDESKGRRAIWACLCDCGNEHEVIGGSLTSGNTKSCGCLPVELGKARCGENSSMWGRKHTEETKEKFKLRRVLRGSENPMWGRTWTDEQREAASKRLKGTKWTEARRAAECRFASEAAGSVAGGDWRMCHRSRGHQLVRATPPVWETDRRDSAQPPVPSHCRADCSPGGRGDPHADDRNRPAG